MGIIQIITPKSSVLAEEPLLQKKQVLSAKNIAENLCYESIKMMV